jgi:hypothetical protein
VRVGKWLRAGVLRSLELREAEIRGRTSNGKNLDAEVAKGAEFRRVEQATAKALTRRARRFRGGRGGVRTVAG